MYIVYARCSELILRISQLHLSILSKIMWGQSGLLMPEVKHIARLICNLNARGHHYQHTCDPLFVMVNIMSEVCTMGKICQRPTTVLKFEVTISDFLGTGTCSRLGQMKTENKPKQHKSGSPNLYLAAAALSECARAIFVPLSSLYQTSFF